MAFLSKTNSSKVTSNASGGSYLNPSKLSSGGCFRFALATDVPLEMFEVWGQNSDGQLKPFRFVEEPNQEDIEAEMGSEFQRRENRDGTGFEAPKFVIAVPVWSYESESISILSLSQKTLIRELDSISQMEDYEDLMAWDFTISREGTGLSTEYTLRAVPMKSSKKAVAAALATAEAGGFDAKRLLTGENPFKAA